MEYESVKIYLDKVREEINKVIVGQKNIIDQVLIALFARGHVLLEGVPGLGKTLLVRTIGDVLDLQFSRIQFTPDLMPADIVGTNIIMEKNGNRHFTFQKGPIFANIILADEINRATPKTQSALLEAMQERSVTVFGTTHKLKEPIFVLATQNPIEMEGTYPLPEAQLDRFFFKLKVEYPRFSELQEIVDRTTGKVTPKPQKVMDAEKIIKIQDLIREVPISSHVKDYATRLVFATHPNSEFAPEIIKKNVRYGSSPRGAQTLVLAGKMRALLDGRYNVSFEDIKEVAHPALRHRIILSFEGEASGIEVDDLITKVLEEVPTILK